MKRPPAHPRRVAFLGTPQAAVPPLRALAEAGFDIAAVVTRVDKRRGRGSGLSPSPVKEAAIELGIPVLHRVDDLLELDPPLELGVVVAFGQLIKPNVLDAVPMINLHFSLLPRWRGAAPVERALLAGDEVTGVCVMAVEEGLDTGGVYAREVVTIEPTDTLDTLRARLVDVGSRLLVDQLRAGLGEPEPQTGDTTYAAKIEPGELRIDWHRPASEIDRLVRLGGAWTSLHGRRLKVLTAVPTEDRLLPGAVRGDLVGSGDNALRLVTVQPEGRGAMDWKAFANGARLEPTTVLGADGGDTVGT